MRAYTLDDFRQDFPDDRACIEWLVKRRYPDGIFCKNCGKVTKHHYIEARKSVSCQECGHHVHPTADTIFQRSSTPLTVWFFAIFRMAQTLGAITARQLERETGVTYKTAWRIHSLIRRSLASGKAGNPQAG